MASPGNQHCANCIGTLSAPIDAARMVCGTGSMYGRVSVCPIVRQPLRHTACLLLSAPQAGHISWRGHFVGPERRSPRLSCLHGLLLPTSSTPAYPAVAGLLTRWPRSSMPSLTLQWITVTPSHHPGRCTKDSNGQITAGVERCCACYHRYSEV